MKKFKEYENFDLAEINSVVLDFWEKEGVFKKSIVSRVKSKPFVFYEGPP